MTQVNFDLRAVAATGRVPVDGRIRWQPVERRTDGGVVILPEVHGVQLVAGLASADLDPGYYWFTEATAAGASTVRLVPAVGPVDYGSLVAVDPATLAPSAVPDPAWVAMAESTVSGGSVVGDDLVLARTDGGTVNAGNVRGPQGLQGDQGLQGIQGLKGDPGGLVKGVLVANGTDFNTLTTDGIYRLSATTGTNLPPIGYGALYVNNVDDLNGNRIVQVFYPGTTATEGRYVASRGLAGGIWSPWRIIPSQRVDQAAGRAIYTWDDLNGREQLVYGDTGWRKVIIPGDNANHPNLNGFIRRNGNEVEFTIYETTSGALAAGVQSLYAVPAGFRYVLGESPAMTPGVVIDSGANLVTSAVMYLASAGTYTVMLRAAAGVRHYSTLRWKTMESWPTTLPGAAYGTIPNL